MRLRLASLVLLAACGSAEPSPAPPPTAPPPAAPPPTSEAEPPPPPPALALPYTLASGGALPEVGTPERGMLDRWAAAVGYDLPSLAGQTSFEIVPATLGFFGELRVLRISGHDDTMPRPHGGTLYLIDEPLPARRLVVRTLSLAESGIAADPSDATAPRRPWLLAVRACTDDELEASADDVGLAACDDLAPTVSRALRERASAGAEAAVLALLSELASTAWPAATVSIVESAADVRGARSRAAAWAPFTSSVDAAGLLHAEGTFQLGGTCVMTIPTVSMRLVASDDALTIDVAPVAVETLTTHCI